MSIQEFSRSFYFKLSRLYIGPKFHLERIRAHKLDRRGKIIIFPVYVHKIGFCSFKTENRKSLMILSKDFDLNFTCKKLDMMFCFVLFERLDEDVSHALCPTHVMDCETVVSMSCDKSRRERRTASMSLGQTFH